LPMTFESFILSPFIFSNMSIEHYENFPVASILMPAHLRPAIKVIYAFARSADDLADEGDALPQERLDALETYENALQKIKNKQKNTSALFNDLAKIIEQHQIPIIEFSHLISAFKQDVTTKRYADFITLEDYCNRSANPVGRIMLHLYQAASAENMKDSDKICTALQIINFWQDVAIDWKKERIYLPMEDMVKFGVTEQDINQAKLTPQWQALMQFEINRARKLMLDGSPLCRRLSGRVGFELRLVVQGGLRILEKVEQVNGDVFNQRPIIGKWDYCVMLWRAIFM
jgi:squalene synthase HpnC